MPGFGANYGILGSELSRLVSDMVQSIEILLIDFEEDIEWLLEEQVVSRG